MAKKQTDTTEDAPIGDGIENDPAPPPAPEKITTVEDLGIGAGDPYPTGKPAEPEVK